MRKIAIGTIVCFLAINSSGLNFKESFDGATELPKGRIPDHYLRSIEADKLPPHLGGFNSAEAKLMFVNFRPEAYPQRVNLIQAKLQITLVILEAGSVAC